MMRIWPRKEGGGAQVGRQQQQQDRASRYNKGGSLDSRYNPRAAPAPQVTFGIFLSHTKSFAQDSTDP